MDEYYVVLNIKEYNNEVKVRATRFVALSEKPDIHVHISSFELIDAIKSAIKSAIRHIEDRCVVIYCEQRYIKSVIKVAPSIAFEYSIRTMNGSPKFCLDEFYRIQDMLEPSLQERILTRARNNYMYMSLFLMAVYTGYFVGATAQYKMLMREYVWSMDVLAHIYLHFIQ